MAFSIRISFIGPITHSQDAWTQIYHGRSHSTFGSDQVCLAESWDLIQIMWKKFGWTLLMIVIIASPHAHAKFFSVFVAVFVWWSLKNVCWKVLQWTQHFQVSKSPHHLMDKYPACLKYKNRFKIDDSGNSVKMPKMYPTSRLHSTYKCIKSGET